jgi:hypothetical protein
MGPPYLSEGAAERLQPAVARFEVAGLRLSQPAASARDRAFAFYAVLGKIPR